MRIGIVGAGALGGLIGAKLDAARADVVLVDPWPEHVSAIESDGLTVRTPGGDRFETHPEAITDASEVGPVDALFVTMKTGIERVNGAVTRYGEEISVPVPHNRLITGLVVAMERRYSNQAAHSTEPRVGE